MYSRKCTCTALQVQKYQKRISGPLLDRIDIQIEVPGLSEEELLQSRPGESSRDIRTRVKRTRAAQAERFKNPTPEQDIITESNQPPQIWQQFARFGSSLPRGLLTQLHLEDVEDRYVLVRRVRPVGPVGDASMEPGPIMPASGYRKS